MPKQLHIVCFNAPWPPDYGGVIDVYYKVKALAETGCDIHLHYFQYQNERGHEGLTPYCKSIHAYRRKTFWQCLTSALPYIVSSRINKELTERLNSDEHPVLLEGIHCTGILPHLRKSKKVILRLHNNEQEYYRQLVQAETNPLRNLYYSMEASRLLRYQHQLPHTLHCAALSYTDQEFFQNKYGWNQTKLVPCFVPWQTAPLQEGLGSYCLYHGDLSVPANKAAVKWLLQHVLYGTNLPFIIAGKNPDKNLQASIAKYNSVQLIANPADSELDALISNAQVNLLPALSTAGVKLKIVHALFAGRHLLANQAAVTGSGLEEAVVMEEDADRMKTALLRLMQEPFTPQQKQQRKTLLQQYNNKANAEKLTAWIC